MDNLAKMRVWSILNSAAGWLRLGPQLWPGSDTVWTCAEKFHADISGFVQPRAAHALQQIFDAVWLVEVNTGGRRPSVALRNEIARRVAEHAGDAELDADEIERAVLAALDAEPEHSLPTFLLTTYRQRRAA